MHTCEYEISLIKPVARRTVHRQNDNDDTNKDNDNTQWTIHDCMAFLAFMPNEPTMPFCRNLVSNTEGEPVKWLVQD